MPETKIDSAVASDLTNAMTDFSVDPVSTDGPSDQKETVWRNEKWKNYLGYYKTIPELQASIDAKATWTVGKGFKADPEITVILDGITGWGNDTFNTIIENAIRTYHIGGDCYIEIIREDNGELVNLKTLDPEVMETIVNGQGIVIRYEQTSKTAGKKPIKFQPEEIFHLSRNRVADEIHGVSVISAVEEIVLMRNEAMTDWKRVLHRNVDPLWIYHMDIDDPTEIALFKAKQDKARGGESMYIPKGVIVPELVATAGNATLNPLPWIDSLNEYFYEAVGVPKIIVGSSRAFTEASAKIAYLAFQQTIEEEQLYIEEEVGIQLGIAIELEFPASLENELLSDKKKDGELQAAQPNDTTAGLGQ